MRVIHVITRLIVGGAQENTLASVLGLAAKPQLEVRLFSGPATGAEGSLHGALSQQPGMLELVPHLVRAVHPWKDLLAYRHLVRLFREQKPDLVHTHSGKAGVLGRLAAARAGVPLILHTIHGPSFGPFQGPLANALFREAERRAGRVTTHFVVVAQAMREQYLRAGIGRPELYTRIFSGFELQPFLNATNSPPLRAQYGLQPDDLVVGTLARLFKLKGHEEIIASAPRLIQACPRLKFLFVGDGPWRERFERRIQAAGLQRHFVFTGLVPPSQVPQLLGLMDIVVHLSRREGLARALPQALAASRPVLAYDCDGASEVCLENQTGFLIPPGDLRAFEARLLELAAHPDLRLRLGQKGRTFVQERFAVEKMVDALYALYLRLAHRPAPVPAGMPR